MPEYKIMTFNVRGAFGCDGEQEFCYRKEFLCDKIRELSPDVIGFQEVSHLMRAELISLLPEYAFLGAGRERTRLGEASVIAYRQSRLMPERLYSEMLSETPHVPGSTYGGDQSDCPRIFSSADFMPFDSAAPFRVINVHTDHIGAHARELEVAQLYDFYKRENELRPMTTVIVGDFNAKPGAPEIRMLSESQHFSDVTDAISESYHGFGECEPYKIDYIFVSKDAEACDVKCISDKRGELYLSDHHPIIATVTI